LSKNNEIKHLDIEKFTNDWNSGMSLVDLAKKYDLSYPSKSKIIAKKLGLSVDKRIKTFDEMDIDIEAFTTDWNSGMSFVDLAKKYDLSYPENARRFAKKLGFAPRYKSPISYKINIDKINIKEFSNDYQSEMSLVDLARKYNFSYPEVAKRFGKKLGLKKQKNLTFFEKFLKDTQKTNELVTMYKDKSITISKITAHFGFPDNGYVSKIIKKIGIPVRRGGQGGGQSSIEKFEKSKNEFIKMWNDDVYKKVIEKKFDISGGTVYVWRKKLGLDPRTTRGVRHDSTAKKTELLLLENLGALTTKEIKEMLNIKTSQLTLSFLYNTKKIQRLSLTMNVTSRKYRKPTDYFGNYAGQSIVYLYGMNDSLILKLSKILQTGRMFKNNLLKKANYNYMISRLAQNEIEIEIENNEQQLYGAIHFKNHQNKLQNSVSVQLQKYTVKQKTHEPISETKSTNSLIQEIIDDMPKSKFYGRTFELESVLNELDSSYPEQQKILVQEIFTPFNFICTSLDDGYFDVKITSNESFLIRFMLHQLINSTTLSIFQSKLNGEKGIIINFEFISESVLKTIPENIQIFNKNDLFSLLNSVEFLPIKPNSFAKIMFGENKNEIVFCNDVDFETNIATISDSTKKSNSILIKFLKHIELPSDIPSLDYFNFVKKFHSISSLENYSAMDEYAIDITTIKNKRKFILITCHVDSNITKILLPNGSINEHIDYTSFITCSGILRNRLIQCDCLAWMAQSDIVLCKHSIAALFYLWKENIIEPDYIITRKMIENFLDYVYLMINFIIKVEVFWYQKMDELNPNYELSHHAICNLVSGEDYKMASFFLNCDENERIELENIMTEYQNEQIKLFDSIQKLSSDQKNLILSSLVYQFREKYPDHT